MDIPIMILSAIGFVVFILAARIERKRLDRLEPYRYDRPVNIYAAGAEGCVLVFFIGLVV